MSITHRAIDQPVSFTFDGASPSTRVEPVTVELAKKHVRYLTTNEDDLIGNMIASARMVSEEYTGRQWVNATWRLSLDRAPCHRTIELPRPPLAGDVVVTYDDVNGDPQTFDTSKYTVKPSFLSADAIDPYCRPGRIVLNPDESWPAVNGEEGCFRIERTCGYGETPDATPNALQSALYLLVAHYHRNRAEIMEAKTRGGFQQIPLGAETLLKPFKALVRHPFGDHHRDVFRHFYGDESRFFFGWGW